MNYTFLSQNIVKLTHRSATIRQERTDGRKKAKQEEESKMALLLHYVNKLNRMPNERSHKPLNHALNAIWLMPNDFSLFCSGARKNRRKWNDMRERKSAWANSLHCDSMNNNRRVPTRFMPEFRCADRGAIYSWNVMQKRKKIDSSGNCCFKFRRTRERGEKHPRKVYNWTLSAI